ncbi:MAG: hypothetical protein ACI8S7_002124 [Candidatus Krumholzibacteriia bacterium]
MHARQVGDQELTFIVSGKLWRNTMVMQDEQTGSLWNHITGECFEGEYKGTTLSMIPVVQTKWADWIEAHPDSRVLKKSEDVKSSQYQNYFDDKERMGIFRTVYLQDRLPGKSIVHGLVMGTNSMAVTDAVLMVDKPMTVDVGEVKVAITRQADGGVSAHRVDNAEALVVRTSYWFAWSAYFPNTAVTD